MFYGEIQFSTTTQFSRPLSLTLFFFFYLFLLVCSLQMRAPFLALSLSGFTLSLDGSLAMERFEFQKKQLRCKEVATLLPVAPPRRRPHPLASAPKQLDVPHRQLFFLFFFHRFFFCRKICPVILCSLLVTLSFSLGLGLSPFSNSISHSNFVSDLGFQFLLGLAPVFFAILFIFLLPSASALHVLRSARLGLFINISQELQMGFC